VNPVSPNVAIFLVYELFRSGLKNLEYIASADGAVFANEV
jgi:hypothetical protein